MPITISGGYVFQNEDGNPIACRGTSQHDYICRGTSQHDYIGFALRVDTSYIFAIIILLFALVNVFIHASTLSLHTYIHVLIQAQRIILLLYIAQPYRLRIYFKSYGSRSPVIETY